MRSRPLRSLLYIPGTKPEWVRRAPELGADACIIDLEDAVAQADKPRAAGLAAEVIAELGSELRIYVRINGVRTDRWLDDLEAVTKIGLSGVMVPKAESAIEIGAVSLVLDRLEERAGLLPGSIEIQPMFESAPGVAEAPRILTSTARVVSLWAGHTLDGDLGVSLGIGWSREGTESLYVRSKLIVDAAAAGAPFPVSGIWSEIEDLDGLRHFAEQSRLIGYTGLHLIHPSHIEIVNEVFTPSVGEIERARTVLAAIDAAAAAGEGAVRLDGAMIDEAMAARSRMTLDLARSLGIEAQ